ncbi:MAG: peroxiredoxin [Oligoflexales bacterium]
MKHVPQVTFYTRVRDESVSGENPFKWEIVETKKIFGNKRIVVFSLPGAFTPTCSSTHLPGYEEKYSSILSKKVDEVYCLSVNDAFTMFQWSKQLGIKQVKMLPDGNGDFTRLMGMLVKKENLGFGNRSWRYSMVVNNLEIEKMFVEDGLRDNHSEDPFKVSDVNTMLSYLDS